MVRQSHRKTVSGRVKERIFLLVLLVLLIVGGLYVSLQGGSITGAVVEDGYIIPLEETNSSADEFSEENVSSDSTTLPFHESDEGTIDEDGGTIGEDLNNESDAIVEEGSGTGDGSSNISAESELTVLGEIQQQPEISPPNYGIQTEANSTACGTVNGNITLTSNVTSNSGICFDFNASNTQIDCAGYTVLHGKTSSSATGIRISGFHNITIKNCVILHNSTGLSPIGIFLLTGTSSTLIINNTIITNSSSTTTNYGIFMQSTTGDFHTLKNNTIIGPRGIASGITINSDSNNISDLYIIVNGSSGQGISLSGDYNLLKNVTITAKTAANGLLIAGDYNIIENNTVNATGNGTAILTNTGAARNSLINNNVFHVSSLSIKESGTSNNNTLIYNNSFGQIFWNLSLLGTGVNLSLNGSGIVLQNNLVGIVGNTTLLGNLTKPTYIELKQLTHSSTPALLKDGLACHRSNDCNISYDPATFILSANISGSLSSNFTTIADNIAPSMTLLTPGNNTINTTAVILSFAFNATDNLVEYYLTCDLWINDTSTKTASQRGTNTSVYNASTSSIENDVGLADGNYYWWVNCTDGSSSNVSSQYNLSIDFPHFAPTINLEAPANNTANYTHNIFNFTFNATDDLFTQSTLSCTLWMNNTVSGTPERHGENLTVKNATSTNLTSVGILSGSYLWWVQCNDGVDSANSTQYLISTTTRPNVTLLSPDNNTNTSNGSVKFVFNATDDQSSTLNCTVWLNRSSTNVKQAYGNDGIVANGSTATITANTTLNTDQYWGWVGCYDGENHETNSTMLNITVKNCYNLTTSHTMSGSTIVANTLANYCLLLNADNIVIDGNGTTLVGETGKTLNGEGIRFDGRNITFKNFNVYGFPIALHVQKNVTIENVTIYNSTIGMFLAQFASASVPTFSTFSNITIANVTQGINISIGRNNTFRGISISNYSEIAVGLFSAQENNFSDVRFNGTGLIVKGTGICTTGCTNYFINITGNLSTSFTDFSVSGDSKLLVQWPVLINVSNETGENIPDITVDVFGADDVLERAVTTSATSFTLPLTEYYIQDEIKYYVTRNQTILAYKDNYSSNKTYLDLVGFTSKAVTRMNLTLHKVNCGEGIISDVRIGANMDCSSSWLIISANNINISGNNRQVTGTLTSEGLNAIGKTGLTVNNLHLRNFSNAIALTNTNSSTFQGLNITNSTIGLYFNHSNNNYVYHSIINNGSSAAAYATNDGNTRNCFINSTIDLNNVTVTSTAEVCKGWYVVVNVSIQDGLPLPGANVTAFVNSSGDKEVTATTGGDGLAYLPVIEQVKNASSTTTVTPHNITVAYSSSISGDFKNTTVVNASGNLVVNLSLAINCTAPLDNTYINKNTVLCPGSFYVANGIIINQSSLQVTCDNTKIIATNSALNKGVYSKGKTGVNVTSCWVEDFYYGLSLLDSSSWILNNITVLSNSQGIYFSNTSSTVISHSNITENSIGIYFGSYYYQRHGNYTIYNNTFSSNGYTLYFYINPALNGANPNISTIYHNTFMTSSTYDVYRYLSSSSDFKTFPSNFNITINNSGTLTNVGNSWDYICNLNFVDADGDGWYDSGSDYPYNLTNYNSYDPGVDYYPQVVSCPASEIFLGSSSSSSSSSSSGDSPSAAVATTAAESVTTTASYSTAADVAAALSASFSGGSLSITNRGDKTATVDVSFDLGIENKDAVIAQLKKQGYEGERLKLKLAAVSTDTDSPLGRSYSYFGLIGPGKEVPYNIGYKITSGQVEGGLLGQIFNDRQLTIPPGETVTLDVAVEGGLNVGARTVTVSFQAFGETVLEKEVVIESKVVTGVAADQRQEDGLVDFYIFIGKENGGDAAPDTITDESTNEITGAAVSNPSTKPTYEFEYSIDKGVSTEFADIATFTSLSNNTLFVQQLHYAGLSAGERTIHTKLRKDGKTVAENSFPISIPASSDAEIGDSAALAGEATGIIHRILLIIFGSGLLVLLLLPIIYFFLFRQRPVSLEQPVLPLKPAYQDSSIPQKPVQNIPEQLYRQESGKITELMKKVHHLDITLEDEKKKKKNSKITELMKRVHHLDISLEDKKLKKKNDNDGEYEHELSYIEQELQKLK